MIPSNDPAADDRARPALAAVRERRSYSKVTDHAPSQREIEDLVSAMSSVADHSGLRPWRVVALRGDARARLGEALAEAAGGHRDKYVAKARRAPLLLAVVVCPRPDEKVPAWEQEAVASGVAHTLGLLLHEAGWGAIWRTGPLTRTAPVHRMLGLGETEHLLGWLYVGGIPEKDRRPKPRKPIELSRHLSEL